MRKFLIIVAVGVFFILILGAILIKLLGSNDVTTNSYVDTPRFPVASAPEVLSSDPAQFASQFYTWYLRNAAEDPLFPYPENRNQVLSPWLTSNYLANWDSILQELEVNPVLLTAEDTTAWGASLYSVTESQISSTAAVRVEIGDTTTMHTFLLTLVRASDGSWRIDSIARV